MIEILVVLIVLAFITEYFTATLGMGYGTMLAPVLLMIGYEPAVLVPVVLVSQFLAGLVSGSFHHRFRNMDLINEPHERAAFEIFSLTGVVGVLIAVLTSIALPVWFVELYIASVVVLMGAVILANGRTSEAFSNRKLGVLGLFGAFNKGISGGGYGPIVTGGQIISGIKPRAAIAITSIVEAVMCAVGFVVYLMISQSIDLLLTLGIIIGAVLAAPFSALTTAKVSQERLKKAIAVATIALGIVTALWVLTAA